MFTRLWSVVLYELKWDLRKFWVYASAVLLLGLVVSGVLLLTSDSTPPRPAGELVTVVASGLPSGQTWTLTVTSSSTPPQVMNSTSRSIQLVLQNGTYNFTVGTAVSHSTAYVADPVQGDLVVLGAPTAQTVRFTPIPGGSGGIDDAQAVAAAETVADSWGGNWTPVEGVGWLPEGVVGEDLTASSTNTSAPSDGTCELTGGSGRWPTVPASTGNYSNGRESSWLVQLTAVSGSGWLFATVQSGTASLIGGVNATCGQQVYPNGLFQVPPVNSTDAARALLPDYAPFLSAHPQASSSFVLRPGGYAAGNWDVRFTTCTPSGGGTGYNFTGSVNARTGTVLSSSTSTGACPVPVSFGKTFPLSGSPTAFSGTGGGSGGATLGGITISRSSVWLDAIVALNGFGILPIVMWVGRPSGTESIARERDKGTLGALFQQPLRRSELLLGKWFAKLGLLGALSFLVVGVMVALSTALDGPQLAVVDAPWIALDLTLVLGFFSALALLFSSLVKRSKNATHLVTGVLVLGLFGGMTLGAPYCYFLPVDCAFLSLSGMRLFLLQPAGTVFVTSLPQSIVTNPYYVFVILRTYLVWGSASSYQMMLWSTVGLVVNTIVVLVLAIVALGRIEIKE